MVWRIMPWSNAARKCLSLMWLANGGVLDAGAGGDANGGFFLG